MTTFPVTGASCHTTFDCMKSDIQTQMNKNISLVRCNVRKYEKMNFLLPHWGSKYASEAMTTLIVTIFMTIIVMKMPDLWFYGIFNILKKTAHKYITSIFIWHQQIYYINLGIEFGRNRVKHSNFFRFWIFWEFFQNCRTQANFNLSSWIFVRKCTNTEWCLIPNFISIVGHL